MTDEKKYSQDELDKAVYDALANRAKIEFEEDTKNVLKMINRRLDEANNYKATIGKDVRALKERAEAEEKQRQTHHQWFQDKVVRLGIYASIIYVVYIVLSGVGVFHALHLFGQ